MAFHVFSKAGMDQAKKVIRRVDREPRNEIQGRERPIVQVPVYRGVTTGPMTARSGRRDGSVMVQKHRFDKASGDWMPTSDPPIRVNNDSKNTTTAAGYWCKYIMCCGFPTLLTMDCSAG